jgi:hypothetical protein
LISKTLRAFLQAAYYCFRLDNDLLFEILAQGQMSHWGCGFLLSSSTDRGGNPHISRNERARNGGTRGEAAEEVKGLNHGGHGGSQGETGDL